MLLKYLIISTLVTPPNRKYEENILNFCEHIHPKIYVKNSKVKLSFRCFALNEKENILYLQASRILKGGFPFKNTFNKWDIISEQQIVQI